MCVLSPPSPAFCGHASLAQDAATPDASGVVALPEVDVEEGGGGARARRRFSRARSTPSISRATPFSYRSSAPALTSWINRRSRRFRKATTPRSTRRCLRRFGGRVLPLGEDLASVDFIAGSGLRTGFGNLQSVQPYTQFNVSLSRDFDIWQNEKPLNLRLRVNLLDTLYLLRSGDGVGEFAPQYGPRRGLYATLTQKF